jgi:hypothetical protein
MSWQTLGAEVDTVAQESDSVKNLNTSVDSVEQAKQLEKMKGLVLKECRSGFVNTQVPS